MGSRHAKQGLTRFIFHFNPKMSSLSPNVKIAAAAATVGVVHAAIDMAGVGGPRQELNGRALRKSLMSGVSEVGAGLVAPLLSSASDTKEMVAQRMMWAKPVISAALYPIVDMVSKVDGRKPLYQFLIQLGSSAGGNALYDRVILPMV